jgi:hypothetical protein
MRDELANLLEAIRQSNDTNGYEAARQAINRDFGTQF